MPRLPASPVEKAEKKVGAVLDALEEETHSDVKDIELEDLVDTNPETGKPEVLKGVDITVKQRSTRGWSR